MAKISAKEFKAALATQRSGAAYQAHDTIRSKKAASKGKAPKAAKAKAAPKAAAKGGKSSFKPTAKVSAKELKAALKDARSGRAYQAHATMKGGYGGGGKGGAKKSGGGSSSRSEAARKAWVTRKGGRK